MSKIIRLPNVTLVCADGSENENLARHTFFTVSNKISFGDLKFFGKKDADLSSVFSYSKFIIKELYKHVNTEFCMIIQADGFPINLNAWEDNFMKFDYIGAPWYTQPWPIEQTVGNGGFSIRSKKFLEASKDLEYKDWIAEDVYLCRIEDKNLKSKGIKFAPHEIAYRFSVEDMPYKGQFGFHGKNTIRLNQRLGLFDTYN